MFDPRQTYDAIAHVQHMALQISVVPMRIAGVEERDSHWEQHQPQFRVSFFHGGEAPHTSWTSDTYDVTDADVLEVIQWAQDQAGTEQLYAVALVGHDNTPPDAQGHGLTWLVGMDANDTHTDEPEPSWFATMLNRRGTRVVDLQ